jgi:hypothetical protein
MSLRPASALTGLMLQARSACQPLSPSNVRAVSSTTRQTLSTRGCAPGARAPRRTLAICLELNTGPSVSARRTDDGLGCFPANPLPLARSRDAFTLSHAEADPPAAELPLARLATHCQPSPRGVLPCVPLHHASHPASASWATTCDAPSASPGSCKTTSRTSHKGVTRKTRASAATFWPNGPASKPCRSPVAPPWRASATPLTSTPPRTTAAASSPPMHASSRLVSPRGV